MISLRIRAGEDQQTIAEHRGTSVEMLERSYSFAIEDLEDEGPEARRGGAAWCPADRFDRRQGSSTPGCLRMLNLSATTCAPASERSERRLRLAEAAAARILQPPRSPESGRRARRSGQPLQAPT